MPHAVTCAILGVSVSWFYKWVHREPTPTEVRRSELDAAVKAAFEASKRTYGSPRIHADLVEAGWTVSVNTVADSMRRQGLQGRKPKRRKGTTKQDKTAPKFPDRLKRDFTAPEANVKWCGDMTEIPTDEGKLYLATVLDLFSRKLLASPTAEHPDAELASDAIKMAAAVRGGRTVIDGVIFHTDRGSTYTAKDFTKLCRRLGFSSRWAGSGRVSITPPRRRSSPPSSMRCCPGIISAPAPRPAQSSSPGARTSTTSNAGTARRRCWLRTSTRESLPSSRTQLKRSLHDFRGNPHCPDVAIKRPDLRARDGASSNQLAHPCSSSRDWDARAK